MSYFPSGGHGWGVSPKAYHDYNERKRARKGPGPPVRVREPHLLVRIILAPLRGLVQIVKALLVLALIVGAAAIALNAAGVLVL